MRKVLPVLALLLLPSVVEASPILIGGSSYDMTFEVATGLVLGPNQTAQANGRITNTGTTPFTFQTWSQSMNATLGYGWNFSQAGWAIGNFGIATDLNYGEGDLNLGLGQHHGGADFSAISGATINPGQSLTFGLWSFRAPGSAPLTGTTQVVGLQFVYQGTGWDLQDYSINWSQGGAESSFNYIPLIPTPRQGEVVILPPIVNPPTPGGGNPATRTPEAGTGVLLLGAVFTVGALSRL